MSPNEVAGLVLTVLTIMGILLGALGWWINTKIKAATYQIQPKTNGGFSLSDLHKKMDRLSTDVDMIKSAVLQLEEDVEQLEHDVEDLK
jgi:cell division protein FtsB